MPAIEYQKKARKWEEEHNIFVPSWKNLQTWITNMCWEEEHPEADEALAQAEHEADEEIGTHPISSDAAKGFW